MMAALRSWLLGVIAVSILCAGADALMPEGPVKRIGTLLSGLLLLSALLPLGQDTFLGFSPEQSAETADAGDIEQAALQMKKEVIEEEYAAYIVDKAQECGLRCTARVTCREEDGLLLPWETTVSGRIPEEEQRRLTQTIASDLGVPAQRQRYEEGEDAP